MTVAENIAIIQTNIEESCKRVGRNSKDITVIAVTKYVTIERARSVIDAGVENLAENRMEGLQEKTDAITNPLINWHFIGTLQTKKVRKVVDSIDYLHALDRLSLASELNKRTNKTIPCFIQVNVSGEETKHGLAPDEVLDFVIALQEYENVEVIGLMTMAPHVEDQAVIRQCFRSLRLLRDKITNKQLPHAPCRYLSMGMSNDYQIAIEEGATHIRIGSNLVGSTESR